MFLLYNCLFTFGNLHLYSIFVHYYSISVYLYAMCYICISIVKAQQNLPNDMCALLGLMRVFAAGWAYRGRRGEGLDGTIIYGVGMVG